MPSSITPYKEEEELAILPLNISRLTLNDTADISVNPVLNISLNTATIPPKTDTIPLNTVVS